MSEMQCAGVRPYDLESTMCAMSEMQCVPSSRKTYPCQKKSLHESCRMGRCIVVMKLICWLSHCEFNGHTVHNLSQRRLTAYWLAPQESDCSQVHSKVSSDWLPSYIKATPPVLKIFKMAEYFLDSPRTYLWSLIHLYGMVFNYQFLTQQQQLCFCVFSWKRPLWQYTIGLQHLIMKKWIANDLLV
jgi:hypothetical protein